MFFCSIICKKILFRLSLERFLTCQVPSRRSTFGWVHGIMKEARLVQAVFMVLLTSGYQSPSGNTVHFLSHQTVSQKPPYFSNRWASRRYLDPRDKGWKSFLFVDKCLRAMQGHCQWGAVWNGDVGTQIIKPGVQRMGGSLGKRWGSPSRERLKAVAQSSRQCGRCSICLHCPRELSPLLSHTSAEDTDSPASHHHHEAMHLRLVLQTREGEQELAPSGTAQVQAQGLSVGVSLFSPCDTRPAPEPDHGTGSGKIC